MRNTVVEGVLFVLISVILIAYALPMKTAGEIYDGVIRLHVIADSDSDDDQAVKLNVRDAILEFARNNFGSVSNVTEAKRLFLLEGDALKSVADGVLEEKGFDDKAEVELCTEYYPMRIYEGVSLPAGEYISLKVIIGSGKGKNWWCVLFPPLCLNSARATEALCGVGISEETAKMLTSGRNRYKIKFWIVDKLGELCERKKCK